MNDTKKTQIEKKTARDEFLAPVNDAKGVAELVTKAEAQLCAVSGRKLDGERVARLAVLTRMACQRNPDILNASRESMFWAFLEAARTGLEWDGEHGALVPFKVKQGEQWVTEVKFLPMVKGLVRLIAEAGVCTDVEAIPVYRGDVFRVIQGTSPSIVHEPDMLGDRSDAAMIAVYAVFRMRDGSIKFDVMARSEIEKRRASSKAQNGPWSHWFVEMSRKTIIKHGIKFLPRVSVPLRDAVEIDTRADMGEMPLAREEAKMLTGETDDEVKRPSTTRGNGSLKAALSGTSIEGVEGVVAGLRRSDEPPPGGIEEVKKAVEGATKQPDKVEDPPATTQPMITDEQKTRIRTLCDKGGAKTTGAALAMVCAVLALKDLESLADLTRKQADLVIKALVGPGAPGYVAPLEKPDDADDPALGVDR